MRTMPGKRAIIFILLIMSPALSGCASIVSGNHQDVMIRSNPPGAAVKIDSVEVGSTPMMISMKRKKRHVIEISKDGYQDIKQATTRGFNGWYLSNLIFGGIIGLFVDPITGAMFDIEPEEVNVTLTPAAEAAT